MLTKIGFGLFPLFGVCWVWTSYPCQAILSIQWIIITPKMSLFDKLCSFIGSQKREEKIVVINITVRFVTKILSGCQSVYTFMRHGWFQLFLLRFWEFWFQLFSDSSGSSGSSSSKSSNSRCGKIRRVLVLETSV